MKKKKSDNGGNVKHRGNCGGVVQGDGMEEKRNDEDENKRGQE